MLGILRQKVGAGGSSAMILGQRIHFHNFSRNHRFFLAHRFIVNKSQRQPHYKPIRTENPRRNLGRRRRSTTGLQHRLDSPQHQQIPAICHQASGHCGRFGFERPFHIWDRDRERERETARKRERETARKRDWEREE